MRIGFIGGGNMASAIIGGMIEKKVYGADQVMASGKDAVSLENLHNKYGIEITEDNAWVMENSDVVFLSVKPQVLPAVISEISPMVKEKQINVYAYNGVTEKENERIEGYITTYCPNYTFEELERDHAYANYYEMVYTRFYTALMFTVDENGLTVDFAENCVWGEFSTLYELPENGINSHKQVTNVEVLPYLKSLNLEGITILCP